MSDTATRRDRLKAAHDKLQEAVQSIVTGEDWQRMLQTAAKFHRYSFQNQLMIFLQRPDATVVAGFNRWKSMGRFVKKGEKGIAIFAPCKYKVSPSSAGPSAASLDGKGKSKGDSLGSAVKVAAPSGRPTADGKKIESDDGEEKSVQQIRGFRVAHVFDISQTEGEDLPDLDAVRPKLLDGSAPEGIWDALSAHVTSIGYEVIRHQRGSENGYCDFLNKQIAVRPDVSPAQAIKTLIHELGHALLHAEGPVASREVAEVEVESIAFIVCDALGLDSGDYSFAYVARWSDGFTELVKDTAERVMGCAKQVLEGLEVATPNDKAMEEAS